ncbi:hypothetical protein GTN42_05900, partial [bacterium]|nr:hypothetical protein [bacterium]
MTTENDGTHSGLSLNGLTVGETYEFILNAHPFLTKKETLTISEGANPSSG